MNKSIFVLVIIIVLSSCNSAKKHNEHLKKQISAEKLKKDVDFTRKKLFKFHPDIDLYVSGEKLNDRFDSLKQTITGSMTANEFYLKISPVVSSIHQGHTSMSPLFQRLTKKEMKKYKDSKGPFSQLELTWNEENLYIKKNKTKDSTILAGSKIISINGIEPGSIYEKYAFIENSDGFNKTYISHKINRKFSDYYTLEIGIQDSLLLVLEKDNETFDKVIYRVFPDPEPEEPEEIKLKDTVKVAGVSKDEKKSIRLKNRKFGYIKSSNQYSKELSFPVKDSTTAVLTIRNFTQGNYKKAYAEIFETIKKNGVENLILDLRNNGGGYIRDANDLFTYLSDENIAFIEKAMVNSKTAVSTSLYYNKPLLFKPLLFPVAAYTFFATRKEEDGNRYFSIPLIKKKKPEDLIYRGNLYVIINGASYSATSLLSSNLKGSNRAVFVGEETGGAYNGTVAGLMPVLKLPNSKLYLRVGIMSIKPHYKTEEVGRGIFPDVEIKPTLEDKIKGTDPEMGWILKKVHSAADEEESHSD